MKATPLPGRYAMPPQAYGELYELFHENSKIGHFPEEIPSDEVVLARMQATWESLPFDGLPEVALPNRLQPMALTLEDAVLARASARRLVQASLAIGELGTILRYAYGVTRENTGTIWPRPFRTVPSGGALYPLELFVHVGAVENVDPGLYHYDPGRNCLRRLAGELGDELASVVVQPDLIADASAVIIMTAMFERSTFKYGDRGYRFVLIECGHVAQNIALAAAGLRRACVTIGGFFDREVDALLGLDGVTHSTVYLAGVGDPPHGQSES